MYIVYYIVCNCTPIKTIMFSKCVLAFKKDLCVLRFRRYNTVYDIIHMGEFQ